MPDYTECPACGAPIDPESTSLSCAYCGIGLPRAKRPQSNTAPKSVESDVPKPVILIPSQGPSADDFRWASRRVAPWATRLYNTYALRRIIIGCLVILVLFSVLCVCLGTVAPIMLTRLFR
jgi:hypothetical protein